MTDSDIVGLGLHEPCVEGIRASGTEVAVHDAIEPNPTEAQIEEGVSTAQRERCDAVLGFGGGSPMDAAKVIAAGLTNDKPVAKLEGPFKVRKQPAPLFPAPTTSGTGAETTIAAVVTNVDERRKYAVDEQGGRSDAELADAFIDAVRELRRDIGIPEQLEEIEQQDIPTIASAAIEEGFELYDVPKYMRQPDAESVVRSLAAAA